MRAVYGKMPTVVSAGLKNEEMIDWMAIQIPKIQRAYKEAYCDE